MIPRSGSAFGSTVPTVLLLTSRPAWVLRSLHPSISGLEISANPRSSAARFTHAAKYQLSHYPTCRSGGQVTYCRLLQDSVCPSLLFQYQFASLPIQPIRRFPLPGQFPVPRRSNRPLATLRRKIRACDIFRWRVTVKSPDLLRGESLRAAGMAKPDIRGACKAGAARTHLIEQTKPCYAPRTRVLNCRVPIRSPQERAVLEFWARATGPGRRA